MTKVRPELILFALLLCPVLSVAAEIHRWVDENGGVHYSDAFSIPEKYRESATRAQITTAPRVEPDRASVALQRKGHVAIVQALLNNSASANLVVDTGASSTMISHALARQLGIEIEEGNFPVVLINTANGVISAPVITLESIEVGGMQVRGLTASVHDISPEVSGLLGLNFLSHFRMDIDSKSGLLHLEKK